MKLYTIVAPFEGYEEGQIVSFGKEHIDLITAVETKNKRKFIALYVPPPAPVAEKAPAEKK